MPPRRPALADPRHDRGVLLVAAHEDVGEFVVGGGGQAAQEQIVDREQFGRLQQSAALAQGAEREEGALGQARVVAPVELPQRLAFGQPVAIEEPFNLPTKRAHLLNVISGELRERAVELGLEVVELSPSAIHQRVVANPRATKIAVAEALVGGDFGQLSELIPKRPKRAALGLRPRDKYWLHMFDALALAVAAATA